MILLYSKIAKKKCFIQKFIEFLVSFYKKHVFSLVSCLKNCIFAFAKQNNAAHALSF